MPVGGPASYFFRGANPEAEAQNPMDALRLLWSQWRVPSLKGKVPGNIVLHMTVGSQVVLVEITDPTALALFASQGPAAIVDILVQNTGLPRKEAISILEEAYTQVRIDVLQDPKDHNAWKPGQTLSPRGLPVGGDAVGEVLPAATGRFIGELSTEEDKVSGRGERRRRTTRGQELVKIALTWAKKERLSLTKASKATGIPRSTLSDAQKRARPKPTPPKAFRGRAAGQRLTAPQRKAVERRLKKDKNAARVAREIGVSARTVRDVRKAMKAPSVPKSRQLGVIKGATRRYTTQDRQKVLALVKAGKTATEASRSLGVPERTGRGWVTMARREGTV